MSHPPHQPPRARPEPTPPHTNCLSCAAGRLAVTCGSESEAKQYEYAGDVPAHAHGEPTEHHHVPTVGAPQGGHADHEAAMADPALARRVEADMRRRFWVALVLSIPIVLYSPVGERFLPLRPPTFLPTSWLLLLLTTPVVVWCGSIFLTGAVASLRARKLNMSVLIATGVLVAYLFSVGLTLAGGADTFFEAAALLVTFVLFGHWMEMRSRRGSSEALRALLNLVPPQAVVLRDGREVTVPTADVSVGETIVIRPGGRIPVDGEVIEGISSVDESLVTGESLPVAKSPGDKVVAGSINQRGSMQLRALGVGNDTALAQIIQLVTTAQTSKAPGQRLADRAAGVLVVVALAAGLLTFLGWTVAGASLVTALTFAVSAIIIACPDALGLATPTVVAVATGMGARQNILIKDAATLEGASRITAVVLDKTGTLTNGTPEVTDVLPWVEGEPTVVSALVVQLAASIEARSEHPLAQAIVSRAERDALALLAIRGVEADPGAGVVGTIDDLPPAASALPGLASTPPGGPRQLLVGNLRLMAAKDVPVASAATEAIERLQAEGKTVMLVAIDRTLVGLIAVADTIRPTSRASIEGLRSMGIEAVMLTGDNARTARAVAETAGIERVFADVQPGDKAAQVRRLQAEGRVVAMVGDGVNDAPALAQADIGIAIGAGTDVAIETANVVLMRSDPTDILRVIRLSKATVRKMKQNLVWASVYNVLAIPVAAGILEPRFGITLRPEVSALLMSASSIIVALNAVLLKRSSRSLFGASRPEPSAA